MFKRLIAALLLTLAWPCMACRAAELENPGAAVKVVDAKIVLRETDKNVNVTVLGNLKNETHQSVNSITVEAKLLDAQGQVVDVLNEQLYGIVVMPGDQVAFRIQGRGASPPASYAQVQARVTSGESQQPQAQAKTGWWINTIWSLFMNWGPILLFIGVWLFFIRRFAGKKTPVIGEQFKLIAEQNALLQRQAAALEKLAKIAPGETAPPPA